MLVLVWIDPPHYISILYFNRDVFPAFVCWSVGGVRGGRGGLQWRSSRGYPGEKLESKTVGGQLLWDDLELRGRLNEKINADQ